MTISVHVEKIASAFMECDHRIPYLFFKLMNKYCNGEMVSLQVDALYSLLEHDAVNARFERPEIPEAKSQLERFFVQKDGSWHPNTEYFEWK